MTSSVFADVFGDSDISSPRDVGRWMHGTYGRRPFRGTSSGLPVFGRCHTRGFGDRLTTTCRLPLSAVRRPGRPGPAIPGGCVSVACETASPVSRARRIGARPPMSTGPDGHATRTPPTPQRCPAPALTSCAAARQVRRVICVLCGTILGVGGQLVGLVAQQHLTR